MPGKGRSTMLWKDVFALSSCTLGFLSTGSSQLQDALAFRFEALSNDPSLKCECTLMCSCQRLAGALF